MRAILLILFGVAALAVTFDLATSQCPKSYAVDVPVKSPSTQPADPAANAELQELKKAYSELGNKVNELKRERDADAEDWKRAYDQLAKADIKVEAAAVQTPVADESKMPPGFTLVSDGNGKFRFKMPGGSMCGYEAETEKEIAPFAWSLYRRMNDKREWNVVAESTPKESSSPAVIVDPLRQPTKAARFGDQISREEFDQLKNEVASLKESCTCGQKSVLKASVTPRQAGRMVRQCLNGQCTEVWVSDAASLPVVPQTQSQVFQQQSSGSCSSGSCGGPIQRFRARRGN